MGSENSIEKTIREYNKQTEENHRQLKKTIVDSHFNRGYGNNIDVNSLSNSQLDSLFNQALNQNPALNNYYQSVLWNYRTYN